MHGYGKYQETAFHWVDTNPQQAFQIWPLSYFVNTRCKKTVSFRQSAGKVTVTKTDALRVPSPLPPCRSTSRWSSCRVSRWWPGKGRRWTWPTWRSSSGCRCRNPCSSAWCKSLTPSSGYCTGATDQTIKVICVKTTLRVWLVAVVCFRHIVWTEFTSGSLQLPQGINVTQKQNICTSFCFFSSLSFWISRVLP